MGETQSSAPSPSCSKADRENIQLAIKVLFQPGQVVEIRVPKAGKYGTISGYFDDHSKLAVEVEKLSGNYEAVYYTLNPVNPALLARANNRAKPYAKGLTTDEPNNIIKRLWLLIDCDPVRPSGIASTDGEKKLARETAKQVRDYLRSIGWPDPVPADSGNGYHLLYRIDLPNDVESRNLVESVLKALAAKFDTSAVKIDQKVFNASRITKAYGTMTRKGDGVPERPHRISGMFTPPDQIETVSKELLEALAAEAPKSEAKKSSNTAKTRGGWTVELCEATLDKANVNRGTAMEYKGATKWQHNCLSNPEHRKPDAFSILDEDGYLHHHCSHNSCSDLTDEDWRKLWEERTREKYPWPGRQNSVSAVQLVNADSAEQFYVEGVVRNNDCGNALRLIRAHGNDVLFVPEAKGWYVWDGRRWVFDLSNVMMLRKAKATVEAMFAEALTLEEDARNSLLKHAMLSGQQARLNAMIDSARSPAQVVRYTEFDKDPFLFNVANATIDLRTGTPRPHNRKDLITKISPVRYDPEATCPRWLQFLDEIMLGDQSKVDFLKRARGYALTGDTRGSLIHSLGRRTQWEGRVQGYLPLHLGYRPVRKARQLRDVYDSEGG